MVALAIKEKHFSKTWSGQSVWITGSPLYEEFSGEYVTVYFILLSSLT